MTVPHPDSGGPFAALREHVDEDRESRGKHERGLTPIAARNDELTWRVNQGCPKTGNPEHRQADKQRTSSAMPVTEAPAREHKSGESQAVGVDHPLQLGRAGPQFLREREQRDIHHQDFHTMTKAVRVSPRKIGGFRIGWLSQANHKRSKAIATQSMHWPSASPRSRRPPDQPRATRHRPRLHLANHSSGQHHWRTNMTTQPPLGFVDEQTLAVA
ncbi:MAG TPA: hypothetical protein VHX38_13185 [Pseudonocardiaceae bacterium]|nr:hypothetical protein [Pseudonocardiaceae bacterium]